MSQVQKILELYKQGKIKESTIIKMAAFKDELTKEAFSPGVENFIDALKLSLGVGAVMSAVGAGAHVLGDVYTKHKMDTQKEPLFQKMLQLHPELKENENQAWQYYEALWHFSPVIATNPMSAGAYIKQALMYHHVAQGPLPDLVQRLVDIEQKHRDSTQKTKSPTGTAMSGFMSFPTSVAPNFANLVGKQSVAND